jgi:hypothetical protein
MQREEPAVDPRDLDLPFVSAARGRVSWLKQQPIPTPGPMVVGRDQLRGELTIDQEAGRRQANAIFEANHPISPDQREEEARRKHWRRQMEILRRDSPGDYADYIRRHPEDAIDPLPPRPAKVQSSALAPASRQPEPEAVDRAVTIPAEAQDLDYLLALEDKVELAGDLEELARIRERIERAVKS